MKEIQKNSSLNSNFMSSGVGIFLSNGAKMVITCYCILCLITCFSSLKLSRNWLYIWKNYKTACYNYKFYDPRIGNLTQITKHLAKLSSGLVPDIAYYTQRNFYLHTSLLHRLRKWKIRILRIKKFLFVVLYNMYVTIVYK